MQKEELSNHSINDPTLLKRKENANDCTTSTWQGPQQDYRAIPRRLVWTEHPLKQHVQMRTVCHNTYWTEWSHFITRTGVAQGKPPIPIVQAPHFNRNLVKFLDLLTGIIEKHVDTRCGRPTRDFIQHSAIRKCFSRWRRHRRTAQPKPRASRTWGDDDDDRMADFEDVHAPGRGLGRQRN